MATDNPDPPIGAAYELNAGYWRCRIRSMKIKARHRQRYRITARSGTGADTLLMRSSADISSKR
jgi:hypothetical protein